MMKGIPMHQWEVKALLAENKSRLTRVVRPQPDEKHKFPLGFVVDGDRKDIGRFGWGTNECGGSIQYAKPRYEVGDILYVKETWQVYSSYPSAFGFDVMYQAGKKILPCIFKNFDRYNKFEKFENTRKHPRWNPSIHMPQEAARIFLRVTVVRVERLQDMPHDAPLKEGIQGYTKDGNLYKYAISDDWWIEYHAKHKKEFKGNWWQDMSKNPTTAFSHLWNSTCKKSLQVHGWDANPWVWVAEFERISKEEAYE